MSKVSDEFQLQTTVDAASEAVQRAVTKLDWKVKESTPPARTVVGIKMSAFSWPGKVEVLLSEAGEGTNVTMNGSIGGVGPVQKKHLTKQMEELRGAIQSSTG